MSSVILELRNIEKSFGEKKVLASVSVESYNTALDAMKAVQIEIRS